MRRRDFVKVVASATGAAVLPSAAGCKPSANLIGRRVLIVALDGLDPKLVQSLMESGRLPNYSRLMDQGSFQRLRTSTPAQTPVAFSNIICGADANLHQVFDFIHRDPSPPGDRLALLPYFSTARTGVPEDRWLADSIPLGNWQLPLVGEETELMRRGAAFWDYLIAEGIDTDVYYVPSNYPAVAPAGPGTFRSISGMGTPDITGSYGEFTFLTSDVVRRRNVSGGSIAPFRMTGNVGTAKLLGPKNFLQNVANFEQEQLELNVQIVRDASAAIAKIVVSGSTVLLAEGEWSDWIPVKFPTGIPGSAVLGLAGLPTSVPGMVRMYLKQVRPKMELYISPVNIDPLFPVNPIGCPVDFARQLAVRHGRFYTAGIPEDTKALSHGALNEDQFLAQAQLVHEERIQQYRAALSEFQRGCLFFYFGTTDLVQHMFWRDQDPQHPGRDPKQAGKYEKVIEELYVGTDQLVGDALDCLGPDDVLIVLSDHGFNSFRRGFNINTWLADSGFIRIGKPALRGKTELFLEVDWSKTAAYGLGMNGVYVNQEGREKFGTVKSSRRASLLREISDKLLDVRDEDGSRVVDAVDLVEDLYPDADPNLAPDLMIGYSEGYRCSWDAVLGKIKNQQVEDNLERWSGTHLIAADRVPGMLLTNRKVMVENPSINDIAPTILSVYGLATPSQMTGRSLFG